MHTPAVSEFLTSNGRRAKNTFSSHAMKVYQPEASQGQKFRHQLTDRDTFRVPKLLLIKILGVLGLFRRHENDAVTLA